MSRGWEHQIARRQPALRYSDSRCDRYRPGHDPGRCHLVPGRVAPDKCQPLRPLERSRKILRNRRDHRPKPRALEPVKHWEPAVIALVALNATPARVHAPSSMLRLRRYFVEVRNSSSKAKSLRSAPRSMRPRSSIRHHGCSIKRAAAKATAHSEPNPAPIKHERPKLALLPLGGASRVFTDGTVEEFRAANNMLPRRGLASPVLYMPTWVWFYLRAAARRSQLAPLCKYVC